MQSQEQAVSRSDGWGRGRADDPRRRARWSLSCGALLGLVGACTSSLDFDAVSASTSPAGEQEQPDAGLAPAPDGLEQDAGTPPPPEPVPPPDMEGAITSAVDGGLVSRSSRLSESCEDLSLDEAVLEARCSGGAQGLTTTMVDLDRVISNIDGKLVFLGRGGFARSCQELSLAPPAWLYAQCRTFAGATVLARIDLGEHLRNVDGELVVLGAVRTDVTFERAR